MRGEGDAVTFGYLIRKQDEILSRLQNLESFVVCNKLCPLAPHRQLPNETEQLLSTDRIPFQQIIDKDEISRVILQTLGITGSLNITNITKKVKAKRGRASRRIIRQRINRLVKQGFVIKVDGRVPTYKVFIEGLTLVTRDHHS